MPSAKPPRVAGFTVVDAPSVLVTHLSETVRRRCHEILSRQDVQVLLDNLKQTHPTLVNELVPAQLTVGQVQRILQNLLAEGISIRNLAGLLEKVSDYAVVHQEPGRTFRTRPARPGRANHPALPSGRTAACAPSRWIPRLEQHDRPGRAPDPPPKSPWCSSRGWPGTSWTRCRSSCSNCWPPGIRRSSCARRKSGSAFRRFFETAFADLTVLCLSGNPAADGDTKCGIITATA